MLAASARLRRSADIQSAVRQGKRLGTPAVLLYFLVREQGATTRIACIVGKRVAASAVVRHKYQRWLRVIAREMLASQAFKNVYDIVLVATPGMRAVSTLAIVRTQVQQIVQSNQGKL